MTAEAPPDFTVVVAASGSGGHLFPARFIIESLRANYSAARVLFIGSGRELEHSIIGPLSIPMEQLDIVGVKNRGLRGWLEFFSKLPSAWRHTREIFERHKPNVIIGVGGYATVLPVLGGWWFGIPTWVHEAELKPGLANWFLSFFAARVSVAFEATRLPFNSKKVFTGHPVRSDILPLSSQPPVYSQPLHVLVLGGSQGAEMLDRTVPTVLASFGERFSVTHQVRAPNVDTVTQRYRDLSVSAEVVPFIDDMAAAYRRAQIIIARSGAGSVMELGVVNRPAVLVPFPYSQGGHQDVNAEFLAAQGKALVVKEGPDFDARLRVALETLSDQATWTEMRDRPLVDRGGSAAHEIASQAIRLGSR
jgi:UDP-N-acetylglucosamine--N-acetylmuramyl-(pentapeptide) pyrophosphoryl-undecaprenol N-acetylglucosamine transferase